MTPHPAPLVLIIATIFSTAALSAPAETSVTIYSSAKPGTLSPASFRNGGEGFIIPGYAMVRKDGEASLVNGRTIVRIADVPALIDPTTVGFESLTDPSDTRVVEQSFEFDLTSTDKLLQKYLDREVTIEQIRGTGFESTTGILIGTQGGLVLRMSDGSIRTINAYSGMKLQSLPGGLISKPTLVWDIAAKRAAMHRVRYSFQTGGITWWADYNLTVSEGADGCKLDLGAWVTIINQSGASFDNAKLKLVAGDVQRAQPNAGINDQQMLQRSFVASAATPGFAEKSFFEYHLYTLGRPATLSNNATKQIELFPAAKGANCDKILVYAGQARLYPGQYGSLMTDRNFGNQSNKKVDVFLRFKNRDENRLGIPLPAGKIRVSKLDSADQSLEFIGEDLIDHTAKNETVQIKLGSAFDVVGERKQVDFRMDSNAKWMEEDIEVMVRNQKEEAVTISVKENLYRWSNWSILRKSMEFEKIDARTITFPLKIAKGAEATVRYTVRYTW